MAKLYPKKPQSQPTWISGSCGLLRSEGLAREHRSSQVARRVRVVIGDRDPFIVRGLESILAAEIGFEVGVKDLGRR